MRRLNKLEQSYSFLSARLPLVTRLGSLSARKNDDFRPTIMLRRRVNNWRDELTTENSLTVWSRRLSSRLSLSSRLGSLVSRLVSRSLSARALVSQLATRILSWRWRFILKKSAIGERPLSKMSYDLHDDGSSPLGSRSSLAIWSRRSATFQNCLKNFMALRGHRVPLEPLNDTMLTWNGPKMIKSLSDNKIYFSQEQHMFSV
jgi:hypothetical protein